MGVNGELLQKMARMRDDRAVDRFSHYRKLLLALGVGLCSATLWCQEPGSKPETAAPVERRDPSVEAASQWINRALYLRCFCAEDNLTFDAKGHVEGSVKSTDWTLAGVQIQKVERKGPAEIQMDGLRVAARYAPDRHEFDRHPQNDEKMHLIVADPGDPVAMDKALRAMFSEGIDRPLQLSMPDYWQHYFDAGLAWPADAVSRETVYTLDVPAGTHQTTTPPQVTKKAEPGYTATATRDRVTGQVKMKLVVDDEGVPRRISILQPLGYGLDAKAVEAAAKLRFTPGTLNGKVVPANVVVNQDYVVVATPQ